MKLTFYGATRTVTGSQHMIEVNGLRILLDCGLYQGRRAESIARNRNLPFDASSVDMLILSHAHIDHSGNIPNLVKSGFSGDILCTHATRSLCATMLLDSGYIQERDVEFINKRRRKRGEPPVEPIYTKQDALASLDYFTSQSYHRQRKIASGIYLRFLDAGHMLGSAITCLDIEDEDTGKHTRLVFSGDLGRSGIPIIRDPETVEEADVLIMESTYGGRAHAPYDEAEKELERILAETCRENGVVLIPAFAVGRTQQLVYALHRLSDRGDIPHMPIYVDSPLAIDTTSVFRLHPEVYDEEILEFMAQDDHKDPFGFEDLHYVRSVAESKRLNFEQGPMVIISASGMMEFGRIRHHLANRISSPKTTILIVGWQAPNTLGRRLLEGAKKVRIFGEEYENRARVEFISGFSGHADHDELMAWVRAMKRKPQRTFLVHGEEDSANALAQSLKDEFNMKVDVPNFKQSFKV